MFGVQRNWHVRAAAIGGVVLIHVAVIVSIAQHRAERSTDGGSRAAFTPIVSQIGENTGGGVETRARDTPPAIDGRPVPDDRAVSDGHWRFETFDIWPSRIASGPNELSSFTGRPATALQPLEPPAPSTKHFVPISSTLRLRRWVRPEYSLSAAAAGEEGAARLELHIDESGRPIEINLVHGAGYADLDRSALAAAQGWTFSSPLDRAQPVRTWAEVEIRFHAR